MTMDACQDLVHITQRRHQPLERRPRRRVALEAVVSDREKLLLRRRRAFRDRTSPTPTHASRLLQQGVPAA